MASTATIHLLESLYQAAIEAALPGPALTRALTQEPPRRGARLFIIALGKAAAPMASAACQQLSAWGIDPAGGLIVAPELVPPPHPAITALAGDHPHPGDNSVAAARALESVTRQIGADDEVWVLLSGGTTSLIGAPIDSIPPADLRHLYDLLLGSGLDIAAMNRIRKRFSRWGAGRLAEALAPARVKNFTISDVIGDNLAAIGSGPCVPDESSASDVRRALAGANLWDRIPASVRSSLEGVLAGGAPETPKPGDPIFTNASVEIIVSNRLALEAIARRAEAAGLTPRILDATLAGEAALTGRRLAELLLTYADPPSAERGEMHNHTFCLIWGGETTVTLGRQPGIGGRNQELALAAAELLAGNPRGAALLSAGTDGRDGPTDAAGAIVDGTTWGKIVAAGRVPAEDLAGHNAFPALESAGALIQARHTGTNVMDVQVGVRAP